MKKVYCKGCEYLKRNSIPHTCFYVHLCLKSSKSRYNENFYSKEGYNSYEEAEDVNKDNNCDKRIQKPFWMFWRGR